MDPHTGALTQRKRLSLGTKPITLKPLQANGAKHVFAASDRPTIIHSANSKLVYSNLNEQHVRTHFKGQTMQLAGQQGYSARPPSVLSQASACQLSISLGMSSAISTAGFLTEPKSIRHIQIRQHMRTLLPISAYICARLTRPIHNWCKAHKVLCRGLV